MTAPIVLFDCLPMSARITEAQCAKNRSQLRMVCAGCLGLVGKGVEAVSSPPAPSPGAINPALTIPNKKDKAMPGSWLPLYFTGEDADIIRRFNEEMNNGLTIEENLATLAELALAGRVRIT